MKTHGFVRMITWLLCICLTTITLGTMEGKAATQLPASISLKVIKIGQMATIQTKVKNVTYKSNDVSIAHVSSNGVVTGKKPGKAIITVYKKGSANRTFTVTVVQNPKLSEYKELPISIQEAVFQNVKLVKKGGGYQFKATIKNTSKKTIKKATFTYEVTNYVRQTDSNNATGQPTGMNPLQPTKEPALKKETKKVVSKINGGIASNKKKNIHIKGPQSGRISDMKLVKATIQVADKKIIYDYNKESYSMNWMTKDSTPPVIDYALDRTFYVGDTIDYKRYIQVSDDRDRDPTLTYRPQINTKKTGKHKVTYTATDSSVNKTNVAVTFTILKDKPRNYVNADKLDRTADTVLSKIIKPSMSDEDKARAIYKWIRGNFSYVNRSEKEDWVVSAYQGLTSRRGDCFVYYAAGQALLIRAGIPCLRVHTYEGRSRMHFWSLAKMNGEYYHFDTTPRTSGGTFCLVTDAQLADYMAKKGKSSHLRDTGKFPKTSTKVISKADW